MRERKRYVLVFLLILTYLPLVSQPIDQGWPDFFSQGPFSIIFNVLGAASSFQGVEGLKKIWIFLGRFVKITRVSKHILQKCHFLAQKIKIFFKNSILVGAFYKNFVPPKLKGRKKSLASRMWPAGRTLAMSVIDYRLQLSNSDNYKQILK